MQFVWLKPSTVHELPLNFAMTPDMRMPSGLCLEGVESDTAGTLYDAARSFLALAREAGAAGEQVGQHRHFAHDFSGVEASASRRAFAYTPQFHCAGTRPPPVSLH